MGRMGRILQSRGREEETVLNQTIKYGPSQANVSAGASRTQNQTCAKTTKKAPSPPKLPLPLTKLKLSKTDESGKF